MPFGGLLAGSLGLARWSAGEDAAAHDLKAKCKKKSGTAKKKCLKKAKAHNAQHAAETPPPPPRCPNPATPNWCPISDMCMSACTGGSVFAPHNCTCTCLETTCCNCPGGSTPFCSAEFAEAEQCFAACAARNPGNNGATFGAASGYSAVCDATALRGCRGVCSQTCGTADAFRGATNSCGLTGRGQCFQPLGGRGSQCGVPPDPGTCGCTNHEQCVANHGPGAFCVLITGDRCTCGGPTTFCATPG